jgi:hypothetical protein
MVYDITELSLRQTITPDHVLGRVNASVRAGGLAAMLVGSLAGGILGGALGLRPTLAIGACGTILGAVWLALSPVRSLREAPAVAVRPA